MNLSQNNIGESLIFYINRFLQSYPELWRNVQVYRFRNNCAIRRLVTREHDILIEGFPRSANSFVSRAFLMNNCWPRHREATHFHCPAHVLLAIKYKIPTVVLIRKPEDAIVSLMALSYRSKIFTEKQSKIDRIRICRLTQTYHNFYNSIAQHKDRFVLGEFESVIQDVNLLIDRVNKKFSTHFEGVSDLGAATQKIFSVSKEHLSPNQERNSLKPYFKNLYHHPKNSFFRTQSEEIYDKFVNF